MNKLEVGTEVVVHDRYRFAIPLRGTLEKFCGDANDGVWVKLTQANTKRWPIGCSVLVSIKQIRRYRGKAK